PKMFKHLFVLALCVIFTVSASTTANNKNTTAAADAAGNNTSASAPAPANLINPNSIPIPNPSGQGFNTYPAHYPGFPGYPGHPGPLPFFHNQPLPFAVPTHSSTHLINKHSNTGPAVVTNNNNNNGPVINAPGQPTPAEQAQQQPPQAQTAPKPWFQVPQIPFAPQTYSYPQVPRQTFPQFPHFPHFPQFPHLPQFPHYPQGPQLPPYVYGQNQVKPVQTGQQQQPQQQFPSTVFGGYPAFPPQYGGVGFGGGYPQFPFPAYNRFY
ncbi:hypothetical protein Ahia01_000535200, partial [Argonauta hians]